MFLYKKILTICVTSLYEKITLRYVLISKIYRIAHTFRAIRSKNKFELFIDNWYYYYNK